MRVRWVQWAIALLAGLALSFAVVWFGPKHMVVCTSARWPNSVFGDQFGHYDGEDFTACDVPTTGTWIAAVAVFVGVTLAIASVRKDT